MIVRDADMREAVEAFASFVIDEAGRRGETLFAVVRRPVEPRDALDVFASAAPAERFFYERASGGEWLVASGIEASVEAAGPRRFVDASAALDALSGRLCVETLGGSTDAAEAGPVLVGGFAFEDEGDAGDPAWRGFPPLRFVLPQWSMARASTRENEPSTWRCATLRVAPGDRVSRVAEILTARLADRASFDPHRAARCDDSAVPASFHASADHSFDVYRAAVRDALGAIRAGTFEKVVLARSCTLTQETAFDVASVLAALRAAHPSCFVYAVGRGDAHFVGATPEGLLHRDGVDVRADALAGTAPRGRTPDEDAEHARALRESKKEQAEHAAVVRELRAALAGVGAVVDAPEAPAILALDALQHLHTRVEARLPARQTPTALTLAGRIHPTPAVAGAPSDAARVWLREHEQLARGWYAGGIGWLAPGGDGSLAVALRCALLRGGRARLYAGAGVVDGSTPDAELEETRLKLRAALGALVAL